MSTRTARSCRAGPLTLTLTLPLTLTLTLTLTLALTLTLTLSLREVQASEDEASDAVVRFVLALIGSADRATLMQLLSHEHRLGLG